MRCERQKCRQYHHTIDSLLVASSRFSSRSNFSGWMKEFLDQRLQADNRCDRALKMPPFLTEPQARINDINHNTQEFVLQNKYTKAA